MNKSPGMTGRRQIITLGAAALATPGTIFAQASGLGDYPKQQIRIIIPFVAGGPTDVLARAIGVKLSERLGQLTTVQVLAVISELKWPPVQRLTAIR